MTTPRSVLVWAALFLRALSAVAQTATAEDYFNQAAKQYVKEDKVSALRTLDKGLQEHPGDARLLKLADDLLKDDQDQQQQEGQGQDGQQDQQGQDGGKDDERTGEEHRDTERPGSPQQGHEQQKPAPGRISPQDAQRLLDAMDRQEKGVQDKVRTTQRPVQRSPIEKDW